MSCLWYSAYSTFKLFMDLNKISRPECKMFSQLLLGVAISGSGIRERGNRQWSALVVFLTRLSHLYPQLVKLSNLMFYKFLVYIFLYVFTHRECKRCERSESVDISYWKCDTLYSNLPRANTINSPRHFIANTAIFYIAFK